MQSIAAESLALLALVASTPRPQDDCATSNAKIGTQTSPAPPIDWIQVNLPGVPGCATDNRVGYGGMSPRSGFGRRVQALRFDDDDSIDLAVSAYNQEAVYILFGPWSPTSSPPYSAWQVITADCGAQPVSTCPETPIGPCTHTPSETGYGAALSAGDVDGDGRDELFVSQPSFVTGNPTWVSRVYVYKWFDPDGSSSCVDRSMLFGLLEQSSRSQDGFGEELAVGEFDAVAGLDLAAGLPLHPQTRSGSCNECNPGAQIDQRGRVRIFSNVAGHLSGEETCTGGGGATLTLDNPQPSSQGSCNGTFGHRMTASDLDGDGITDLFVNAPGNGGACAFEGLGSAWSAGQVLLFKGPISDSASPTATLEDVNQLPCCAEDGGGGRFGFNRVAVGTSGNRPVVAVGAPRKNLWGFEPNDGPPMGCGSQVILPKYFDDPGGAFRFVADDLDLTSWTGTQLIQNSPVHDEVVGYHVLLTDFSSQAEGNLDSDFLFVGQEGPSCTPRIVYWDAEGLTEPPANIAAPASFPDPPGETGGNWAFGGEHAGLWSSAQATHDQVVLGDPAWFQGFTCPSAQPTPDGRLLILFRTYP